MALKITRIILLLSELLNVAQGHGYFQCPQCQWTDRKKRDLYSVRINFTALFNATFPTVGSEPTFIRFKELWDPKKLSVKDIIQKHGKLEPGGNTTYGYCAKDAPAIRLPKMFYFGNNVNQKTVDQVLHEGPAAFYCDNVQFMLVMDFRVYNNPHRHGLAPVELKNTSVCGKAKSFQFFWLTTQSKEKGGGQGYVEYFNIDNVNGVQGFQPEDLKYCPKQKNGYESILEGYTPNNGNTNDNGKTKSYGQNPGAKQSGTSESKNAQVAAVPDADKGSAKSSSSSGRKKKKCKEV
uniref:AlNc14C195G8548 protein n=1 Tax=Albugo laibachii Nc14 TaxID=890382 RepID=F0WQ67_9STRA|nr:AlNc14C195G8548 [Albugo laibachii Nc14]CCA26688.1 AlNc14C403G11386 [Albugo laibachii Nc14]|eukprot:CCA26688.1 AlNc14C403G11386 [Albugo laibachii Nc14]